MKQISKFSLFSAIMLTAGSAFAGGGALLGGSGGGMEIGTMYGGVGAGQATTNCMIYDFATYVYRASGTVGANHEKNCDTTGWKAYGGYKLTDNFAVEGGYYSLGDSKETLTEAEGTVSADGSASGLGLAAVASLPVVDNLEVFGKAGLMKWKSEGTVTVTPVNSTTSKTVSAEVDGSSLLLGVGASYKFTDNLGVRGEYERFTRQDINNEDRDVGILSVGATFSTL